jgi:hypothetical protein
MKVDDGQLFDLLNWGFRIFLLIVIFFVIKGLVRKKDANRTKT